MKRAPFPPITRPEASRIPRSASYGGEINAGRCLIALTYTGPRRFKRVVVRNCYRRGDDPIVVENMREMTGKRIGKTGVSLKRLQKEGWSVLRGPFMVKIACPNCIVDLERHDFESVWQNNRDEIMGSIAAYQFPDKADFPGTPTFRMISRHWEEKRVHEGWDPARIHRLCRLWNLTPHELAELIQWAPGKMDGFMKVDGGWAKLPGPVAVWFYFLENVRFGVSVFPEFSETAEAQAS